MSILIKGMEMPSCEVGYRAYMDFRIWNDGTVEARIGPKETEYKAVPVPPHGRLGDLDALTDKVIGKYIGHERKNELIFAAAEIKQDICDLIGDAPTIIPAEEGE